MLVLNKGDYKVITEFEEKNISGHVANKLSNSIRRLHGKFIQEDGSVDYEGLKESKEFEQCENTARMLNSVVMSDLSSDGKKAFLINIYNALTIHSLIAAQTDKEVSSPLDVEGLWTNYGYLIGGHIYNLDQIEHGLLRANKPHPTTGKALLTSDDPRAIHILHHVDCRLHCALNCGARGCPSISSYIEEGLDEQLDNTCRNFIMMNVSYDKETNVLNISEIFKWYEADFGPTTSHLVEWICLYIDDDMVREKAKLANGNKTLTIEYFYDWKLNKKINS